MAGLNKKSFDAGQLVAPGVGAAAGAGAGWLLADPVLGLKQNRHKSLVAALGALAGAATGAAVGAMDVGGSAGEKQRRENELGNKGLNFLDWWADPSHSVPAGLAGFVTHGVTRPAVQEALKLAERPATTRPGPFKTNTPAIKALRILTGGQGKGVGSVGRTLVSAAPITLGTLLPAEVFRRIQRATTKTD